MSTIDYYDTNARDYYDATISASLAFNWGRFLLRLPSGGNILDFGCGSGRDTKYFLSRGFQVDAIDGSARMCELASALTGIKVKNMLFQDLDITEKYDGIWACASILHLSTSELASVMDKMARALKDNGVIYASFKYGTFSGERDGRFFTDMTDAVFAPFIRQIDSLTLEEQWITPDVCPGSNRSLWFNVILRKTEGRT